MIKILPLFYKLTGIKGLKSQKIKDGITNINYKIKTKDQDYVIRIPRKDIVGINRANEKKVIDLIKQLNFNVEVIYFNEETGIMISKYIKAKKRKQIDFNVVINHIKQLHSLDIKDIDTFDPFKLIDTYKNISSDIKFVNQEKVIEKAKQLYKAYPLVLCHNDLLYANFIKSDNKEYLIDYEYAGKNIALFDIVSFLSENDILDITKQVEFINMYYGRIDSKLLNDINIMFLFLDLLWGYWAYAMYSLYKEDIFLAIATLKHKRYNAKSYIC